MTSPLTRSSPLSRTFPLKRRHDTETGHGRHRNETTRNLHVAEDRHVIGGEKLHRRRLFVSLGTNAGTPCDRAERRGPASGARHSARGRRRPKRRHRVFSAREHQRRHSMRNDVGGIRKYECASTEFFSLPSTIALPQSTPASSRTAFRQEIEVFAAPQNYLCGTRAVARFLWRGGCLARVIAVVLHVAAAATAAAKPSPKPPSAKLKKRPDCTSKLSGSPENTQPTPRNDPLRRRGPTAVLPVLRGTHYRWPAPGRRRGNQGF